MENIRNILNKKKWHPPKVDSFDGLPIRPPVKRTRFYLDNEYWDNGYAAAFPRNTTAVYIVLARRANHRTQVCYPSAEDIIKLSGIRNRNHIFKALKILEAYNIIAIIHHSKGRIPNRYALLEPSAWKNLNSIPLNTVRQRPKKKATVSLKEEKPYQNPSLNSIADDTPSKISNSEKEIRRENFEKKTEAIEEETNTLGAEELLAKLPLSVRSLLGSTFKAEDLIKAVRKLLQDGKSVGSIRSQELLEVLQKQGAMSIKPVAAFWNYRPRAP